MKKIINKPFPKKAKLITFGGFYKVIKIDSFALRIRFPLITKVNLTLSEFTYDQVITHDLEFGFTGVKNGYAEYHQTDFVHVKNEKL